MNRRDFLKKSALLSLGVVAADQLELLEKLGHSKIWTGHTFPEYFTASEIVFREGEYNRRFVYSRDNFILTMQELDNCIMRVAMQDSPLFRHASA